MPVKVGEIVLDQVTCPRCGAHVTDARYSATWVCQLCSYDGGSRIDEVSAVGEEARSALGRGEAGRAMQLVQEALRENPTDESLSALRAQIESHLSALRTGEANQSESLAAISEAENYNLQATFVLHSVQANIQVYGSNSMLSGAQPANVDLGLQYINRSLELFPDNAIYLNTKALLLSDGKGDKENAKKLLEKAAALAPRDINIQNNLNAVSSGGCFIATAAFGTPFADELNVLRGWRDDTLASTIGGRAFVRFYYAVSPRISECIRKDRRARAFVRGALRPLVDWLRRRK